MRPAGCGRGAGRGPARRELQEGPLRWRPGWPGPARGADEQDDRRGRGSQWPRSRFSARLRSASRVSFCFHLARAGGTLGNLPSPNRGAPGPHVGVSRWSCSSPGPWRRPRAGDGQGSVEGPQGILGPSPPGQCPPPRVSRDTPPGPPFKSQEQRAHPEAAQSPVGLVTRQWVRSSLHKSCPFPGLSLTGVELGSLGTHSDQPLLRGSWPTSAQHSGRPHPFEPGQPPWCSPDIGSRSPRALQGQHRTPRRHRKLTQESGFDERGGKGTSFTSLFLTEPA